jgi:hypothetical protein
MNIEKKMTMMSVVHHCRPPTVITKFKEMMMTMNYAHGCRLLKVANEC